MKLDQEQAELYTRAGWVNEYDFAPGVMILPVAEEPPSNPLQTSTPWSPVVAVRAHAPYRTRTVTYSAKKTNAPPFLPTPTDSGDFLFVGGSVAIPYPTLAINGLYEWDATAQYTYVSATNNAAGDGLVLGGPAFVTTIQAQNALSGGNLVGAPSDVVNSGVGPKAGYSLGRALNTNSPNYSYSEPTFFPATFFSQDMVSGPTAYPTGLI